MSARLILLSLALERAYRLRALARSCPILLPLAASYEELSSALARNLLQHQP